MESDIGGVIILSILMISILQITGYYNMNFGGKYYHYVIPLALLLILNTSVGSLYEGKYGNVYVFFILFLNLLLLYKAYPYYNYYPSYLIVQTIVYALLFSFIFYLYNGSVKRATSFNLSLISLTYLGIACVATFGR